MRIELSQPELATLRILLRERLHHFKSSISKLENEAFHGNSEAIRQKALLEERVTFHNQLLGKLNK